MTAPRTESRARTPIFGHFLPVVFNLSSWAVKHRSLVDWLVDELNERYDVPRKMGQAWIDADAILPLLDGLDEVAREHRKGCAEAINAFRADHGLVPLSICSRVEEYESLTSKLRLSGAILIRPMTGEQVDGYLARAGRPLAGVRQALQADVTLHELFDTPLMLSVAAMVYGGVSASDIQVIGALEERRSRLFGAYVNTMFNRRGYETCYARDQTERWLSWLAQEMGRHDQTAFHLAWMQATWLPSGVQQQIVTTGIAVLIGSVVGLIVYLLSMLGGMSAEGLTYGSVLGLVFGLVAYSREIRPPEKSSWSWSEIRVEMKQTRVFCVLVGLFFGLIGASITGLIGGLVFWDVGGTIPGLVGGLVAGLAGWLLIGVISGLVAGLFVVLISMLADQLRDATMPSGSVARSPPGQRVHSHTFRILRNSLFYILVIGLPLELCCGVLAILEMEEPNTLRDIDLWVCPGLALGLLLGTIVGLRYGGRYCMQHFLLRFLLWCNGFGPLNYERFLDYATERIFLHRVGSGYIFIHRLLMEHFAAKWEANE